MKAIVIEKPGNMEIREADRPKPDRGQILVKVMAAGICRSDLEMLDGDRPADYVRYPVIPGHEFSGVIEEVGPGVTGLPKGTRVAIEGHNYCGKCFFCRKGASNLCATYNEFGFTLPGGYAEFALVRVDLAHPFPASLSFEEAALTEPAACAGHGVMLASPQPADTVVVIGPGTIGLLTVCWLKRCKPAQLIVVGVDRSVEELARSVGATHFLSTNDNPADEIRRLTGGRGADAVFETAGHPDAVRLALDIARRGGSVTLSGVVGGTAHLDIHPDLFSLKQLRIQGIFAYTSSVFTQTLKLLASQQLMVKPLITHRFPLDEAKNAFFLLRQRAEPVVKIILKPYPT